MKDGDRLTKGLFDVLVWAGAIVVGAVAFGLIWEASWHPIAKTLFVLAAVGMAYLIRRNILGQYRDRFPD